jgi:hypothetical protein
LFIFIGSGTCHYSILHFLYILRCFGCGT